MKNVQKWSLIVLGAALLAACGSSGSGSGSTSSGTTTVVTPTKAAGTATYTGGKYMYTTADGQALNLSVMTVSNGGKVSVSGSTFTSGASTVYVPGTLAMSGYSYTRFGSYVSADSNKLDTFAMGSQATVATAVPTAGTAVYSGVATRATAYGTTGFSSMNFNVDFGSKTINGTTTGTPDTNFGNALTLSNGTLAGAGFSGTAVSGSSTGTFSGNFYGPVAEELAGTASFSGSPKVDAAFGGKK